MKTKKPFIIALALLLFLVWVFYFSTSESDVQESTSNDSCTTESVEGKDHCSKCQSCNQE